MFPYESLYSVSAENRYCLVCFFPKKTPFDPSKWSVPTLGNCCKVTARGSQHHPVKCGTKPMSVRSFNQSFLITGWNKKKKNKGVFQFSSFVFSNTVIHLLPSIHIPNLCVAFNWKLCSKNVNSLLWFKKRKAAWKKMCALSQGCSSVLHGYDKVLELKKRPHNITRQAQSKNGLEFDISFLKN